MVQSKMTIDLGKVRGVETRAVISTGRGWVLEYWQSGSWEESPYLDDETWRVLGSRYLDRVGEKRGLRLGAATSFPPPMLLGGGNRQVAGCNHD